MQLKATLRTITGKQVHSYRKKNLIPGVVYGKYLQNSINVFFDKNDFLKIYKECGKSLPIEMVGDGIEFFLLIHSIDLNPVDATLSHVDFIVLNKGEKVSAEVLLRFFNESPVDKQKIGRINKILPSVKVVALPNNLPKYIDVDLSVLKNIHDVVSVKDLSFPVGVVPDCDLNLPVVTAIELANESEFVSADVSE